jgi:hypothetical protein
VTTTFGPLSPQEVRRRLEAVLARAAEEEAPEEKKALAFDPNQPRDARGRWVEIGAVDPGEFSATFNGVRNADRRTRLMTTEHEPSYYTKAFLTSDGKAGVALHGDEIVNLFNKGGGRGAGRMMLRKAVEEGGRRLDATGEFLRKFYESEGFEVTDKVEFDPKFAPDEWDTARDNRPNIYFMGR